MGIRPESIVGGYKYCPRCNIYLCLYLRIQITVHFKRVSSEVSHVWWRIEVVNGGFAGALHAKYRRIEIAKLATNDCCC
jgi:hypothetical protein